MVIDKQQEVKELWESLGNIPVDNDDCIELKWHIFPAGTDKFTIWHWFEEKFNISVAVDLMRISQK